MLLYEMQVSKTAIYRTAPARIPKGLVGAVVKLSFSPEWEGLKKTVVFRAGEITKDILDVKEVAVIPAECTQEVGALLEIGVYGVDAGNTVAIPTLWAAIGRVSEAADPSGDVTTDPQLPVYAQLQAQIDQLERQGITQNEIEQAIRDFFGGERPVGRTTPEGGEIFNDYENNEALAPYSKADGAGCRAGIHGYKLLAVAKDGENYNITVGDADLESKARDNYATGELLCFDGQGHFYDCLKITAISTNADGNSVITVTPTDDRDLTKLVVDESTDELENWVYVLKKPNAGEPVKAAYGAYSGGVGSVAVGYGAFAHGANNQSIGKYAYTAGRDNIAHYAGYAKGRSNKALGENSSAEGIGNTASGISTHAEGNKTNASGTYAHSEGNLTTVSGKAAHAEGDRTKATGDYSHAEGSSSVAEGKSAHAEGGTTTASGMYSHAQGRKTVASGAQSHAEGNETIASGNTQHVQGKWNVPDAGKAHIVGGGTSDTDRKNIYTLDWNGNAYFAGGLETEYINVATENDIDNALTAEAAKMSQDSVRFFVFRPKDATLLGGAKTHCVLRKVSGGYATAEFTTYWGDTVPGILYKDCDDGVWAPFSWLNPPMLAGVEYRTTERYNGKVVYTKLIGFGGLPDANLKSVTAISERVSVVSFSGVAYDGVETDEFPVIFSTGLAAYAYTSLGASETEIMVRTLQNLSGYSANFVIKYIKD